MSSPISAGATTMELASEAGLSVGDDLVLSGGGNSEEVTISAFGSIMLAEPTVNGYAGGTTVTMHYRAQDTSSDGSDPDATIKDDPHVCNLKGECFDIRARGEYTLFRAPYDLEMPDILKVEANLDTDGVQPCGQFVKEVAVSGSWLNNQVVRVRPFTRNVGGSNFAGTRTLTNFSMQVGDSPWRSFSKKLMNSEVPVGSSKVKVRFVRREEYGIRAESQSVQFELGEGSLSATLTVYQASHQALNLELAHAGRLGYTELRGVLGTDAHEARIEEASKECLRSRPVRPKRDGLPERKSQPHSHRASSIGAYWD